MRVISRGLEIIGAFGGRELFKERSDGIPYTITPWDVHDFFIGPAAFRNFFAYLPMLWQEFASTRFRPAAPRTYPDAWQTARHWQPDQETPFEQCRILDPEPTGKRLNGLSPNLPKLSRRSAAPKSGKAGQA